MNAIILPASDVSAQIARLFVYPVKSCAGVELQSAALSATGLALDRAWMVVDAQGRFVTQREQPRLALVQPGLTPGGLELRAPAMAPLVLPLGCEGPGTEVKVWDEAMHALDMGEGAAQWFSRYLAPAFTGLAQPYRLVRFDPAQRRTSSLSWTGGVPALNQFSDGFPLLVIGEASLANLNQKLVAAGHAPVGMERFRPNLVLSGLQAHDEDRVGLMTLDADAVPVLLKPVKPCPRCPIPNIDPHTGSSSPEVGDTLQTYRQDARLGGAVTFGMNVIALAGVGAVLRVGQRVSADFDFG